MIKKTLLIVIASSILLVTGCSKPVVLNDVNIKSHWMKKGDPAPFDGIELNSYTYYKLVKKAKNCKK